MVTAADSVLYAFQSTSSVWRTTAGRGQPGAGKAISIHVLRVEDDAGELQIRRNRKISIHVLRVEDDPAARIIHG